MIGTVHAGEIEVQLTQMTPIADDDVRSVSAWNRIQGNYVFDNGWYGFGSFEEAAQNMMGRAWDYEILGVGVGLKKPLTQYISVFGQFGYYIVDNSVGHTTEPQESLEYYANSRWHAIRDAYYTFDSTEVKTGDTFGGELGVDVTYPVSKNFTLGFLASVRVMEIPVEVVWTRDEWVPPNRWEIHFDQNMTSFAFGFNVGYQF
jgi:hypothetical protein